MNVLKQVETHIHQLISEVFSDISDSNILDISTIEIKYNGSLGRLYTLIAFRIYTFLKQYNEYNRTPEWIAEKIVEKSNSKDFILRAEKGYINIQLSNTLIDSEIEEMAKNTVLKPIASSLSEDDFLLWYCHNKLSCGFEYLWEKHNSIKATHDPEAKVLALYAIFINCSEQVSISTEQVSISKGTIKDFAALFYEYDRKIAGVTVPYDLYRACLGIFLETLVK